MTEILDGHKAVLGKNRRIAFRMYRVAQKLVTTVVSNVCSFG